MAMSALSLFRPRVAALAPTATDPMIDQAVLDSCIDFCERTLVVKRMLTSFVTVANTASYTPAAPTDQSIAHIMRVWLDTVELVPLDEEGVASPFGFITTVAGATNLAGTPSYFNETDPGTISLFPRPNAVYTINARVALRPLRTATTVDTQLFEDWAEGITCGALARLFLVPGELMNAPLAKFYSAGYQSFADRAQLQASKGRTRAQNRITPVHI